MEPITLCGTVIVAFGLWVEFESIFMKAARAISECTVMTAIIPSTKKQRRAGFISPNGYGSYRAENGLQHRMARN